ncbi:hypothetical protein V502_03588 [Pseudogymnoascus sp. VKM F-4520 (FW-2644)]|nr:hypothetical protein V502_03588 [Pseudogymnoascus sp. VKM F-4520 (FW-2644)]
MSQATGNTAETSGDNTSPPDNPDVMQIREVLSKIDEHLNQAQQDGAQFRQAANQLYQIASRLEKAAGPFTEGAVVLKHSADQRMKIATSIDRQVDEVNQSVSNYRERLDLANGSYLDEFDPIGVDKIMRSIETYKLLRLESLHLEHKHWVEKHYEEFNWLMVVESIVRPTNTSD